MGFLHFTLFICVKLLAVKVKKNTNTNFTIPKYPTPLGMIYLKTLPIVCLLDFF